MRHGLGRMLVATLLASSSACSPPPSTALAPSNREEVLARREGRRLQYPVCRSDSPPPCPPGGGPVARTVVEPAREVASPARPCGEGFPELAPAAARQSGRIIDYADHGRYPRAHLCLEEALTLRELNGLDADGVRASFRHAGELYRRALELDTKPALAIEPAINGAYAFEYGDRLDDAVALIDRFLAASGEDEALEPGLTLAERRRYVAQLLERQVALRFLQLRPAEAASKAVSLARARRLPVEPRRMAARRAALLYAALGEEAAARAALKLVSALSSTPAERVDASLAAGQVAIALERARDPDVLDRAGRRRALAVVESLFAERQRAHDIGPTTVWAAATAAREHRALADGRERSWCEHANAARAAYQESLGFSRAAPWAIEAAEACSARPAVARGGRYLVDLGTELNPAPLPALP